MRLRGAVRRTVRLRMRRQLHELHPRWAMIRNQKGTPNEAIGGYSASRPKWGIPGPLSLRGAIPVVKR